MATLQPKNNTNQDKSEEPKEENPKKKEDNSKSGKSKQPKVKEKEVYFIIYYQRKQKENPKELFFSEDCDSIPQAILTKEVKTSTNKYAYKKVYKYKNKGEKELVFFFGQEDYKYIITFEVIDKTFIYDVKLEKGHKFLEVIPKENIDQKFLKYQDKLDLFLEALKLNKEEKKNELLYQETIDLYSKKSNFSFLISLFPKFTRKKNRANLCFKNFMIWIQKYLIEKIEKKI